MYFLKTLVTAVVQGGSLGSEVRYGVWQAHMKRPLGGRFDISRPQLPAVARGDYHGAPEPYAFSYRSGN